MSKKIAKRIVILFAILIILPFLPSRSHLGFRNLRTPSPSPRTPAIVSSHIFAQVSEQEDPFYRKLFDDGKYFYNNGNYSEAIQNFEIAFFGFLDNPARLLECYVYLTVCHSQIRNLEKSKFYNDEIKRLKLQEYLKSITPPENLLDKYYEIDAYFSRLETRTGPTGTTASTTRTTSPTITSPYSSRSLNEEINQLKQAIKKNSGDYEAYLRLSAIYIEQKRFKNAKSILKDLTKVNPRIGFGHFELGKIYAQEKKYKEALQSLEKAAPLLPDNIEVHYELGKLYFDLKNYEKAKIEFEAVQKINETYKDTEKFLALIEEIQKRAKKR